MKEKVIVRWFAIPAVALLMIESARAANITMNATDNPGETSFDAGLHWTGGAAPAGGNAYFTAAFFLRSPATGGDYTFAGDSLSLDSGGGMNLKTSPGTITISNFILNGGRLSNGQGAVTVAGNINVTSNSTFETQGRNTTVTAPISGASNIFETCLSGGAGTLGTVILSTSNSFSGKWIINDANNTAGYIPKLNLATGNALQGGTLVLTTTNDNSLLFGAGISAFTLGGLSGNGNFGLTNTGGAITLQVGNNNVSTEYSGVMSGSGSLIKIGTGTLTILGTNTYTGGTVVSNGTLCGNGMITGMVNVASGGTLSPGTNAVGIFTVGALTLGTGGALAVKLGGTNTVDCDQLVVSSGSISPGSGLLSLSLTNSFNPRPGDLFTIIRNVPNNPVVGRFACGTSLRMPGIPGSFFVNYTGGTGNDVVLRYLAEGTVVMMR